MALPRGRVRYAFARFMLPKITTKTPAVEQTFQNLPGSPTTSLGLPYTYRVESWFLEPVEALGRERWNDHLVLAIRSHRFDCQRCPICRPPVRTLLQEEACR